MDRHEDMPWPCCRLLPGAQQQARDAASPPGLCLPVSSALEPCPAAFSLLLPCSAPCQGASHALLPIPVWSSSREQARANLRCSASLWLHTLALGGRDSCSQQASASDTQVASVSVGSTSSDSTNCTLKIFEEKSVLNLYRLYLVIIIP